MSEREREGGERARARERESEKEKKTAAAALLPEGDLPGSRVTVIMGKFISLLLQVTMYD